MRSTPGEPEPSGSARLAPVGRWLERSIVERTFGGRERFLVIGTLGGVLAVDAADKGMIGATVTQLQSTFGIGPAEVGLLVTVSGLVAVAATLPFGVLVDRVSRLRLLRGVIVVWAVAMMAGAVAPTFRWLVASRLLLGLASAAAAPAVASLVGDWFAPEERARVLGLVLAGELAGTGLGLAIGVGTAWLSWRVAFVVVGLSSLAVVGLLRRLHEPDRNGADVLPAPSTGRLAPSGAGRSARPSQGEALAGSGERPDPAVVRSFTGHGDLERVPLRKVFAYVIRVRTNVVVMVSSALGYYVFAGLRTFGFEFADVRYGAAPGVVVLVLAVGGALGVVGVVVGGRLSDVALGRGWLRVRIVLPAISLIAMALVFVPAVLTTSLTVAAPLLIAAAFFLALSNPPLDAARLDVLPAPLRGRAESIKTVLRSGLEALAPSAFGATAALLGGGGHGLEVAMLLGLIPLVASPVLLLVYGRRSYLRDIATARAVERVGTSGAPSPGRAGRKHRRTAPG